ncbi:MAG: sigma-70 family RNA polymerase sigma factor [Thermodesulfobacteriota bacterium]|nr:sigma-70 family RNA polymerase sigma factor [Thermodesulfobacteriota bacterium]
MPNPSQKENQRLLSGCISGDRKASEAFVRRFSPLVYKYVQHTLIVSQVPFNEEDIADLHNTVFLQLFDRKCKKLRQYKGKNGCNIASWIRLVTARSVLNHIRQKGSDVLTFRKNRIPIEVVSDLKSDDTEPGSCMEEDEQERLIRSGIRNLAARDRLFVRLHFENGLSLQEVADIMHLSVQHIHVIKHRAIQRLKSLVISGI